MKPVVVDPQITLTQLLKELAKAADDEHRAVIRDQLLVKLRRRLKKIPKEARKQYEAQAGETPEATLKRIETSATLRTSPISRIVAHQPVASDGYHQAIGNADFADEDRSGSGSSR